MEKPTAPPIWPDALQHRAATLFQVLAAEAGLFIAAYTAFLGYLEAHKLLPSFPTQVALAFYIAGLGRTGWKLLKIHDYKEREHLEALALYKDAWWSFVTANLAMMAYFLFWWITRTNELLSHH